MDAHHLVHHSRGRAKLSFLIHVRFVLLVVFVDDPPAPPLQRRPQLVLEDVSDLFLVRIVVLLASWIAAAAIIRGICQNRGRPARVHLPEPLEGIFLDLAIRFVSVFALFDKASLSVALAFVFYSVGPGFLPPSFPQTLAGSRFAEGDQHHGPCHAKHLERGKLGKGLGKATGEFLPGDHPVPLLFDQRQHGLDLGPRPVLGFRTAPAGPLALVSLRADIRIVSRIVAIGRVGLAPVPQCLLHVLFVVVGLVSFPRRKDRLFFFLGFPDHLFPKVRIVDVDVLRRPVARPLRGCLVDEARLREGATGGGAPGPRVPVDDFAAPPA
mmetsp:Transcript_23332/g.55183  ORF Transcript_23332/g.55183 Transcript_23332/m.55183 type:complete len:325 (+) Transcript_23332:2032-3006(+)